MSGWLLDTNVISELRKSWPEVETLAGIALLIAGVVWAVRTQPAGAALDAHPK